MGAMNNVRVMPPPPAIGILTSQRESLAADQWRTMAVIVTEHLLEALKAPLSNPAIKLTPPLQPGEIYDTEELLARLKSLNGAALVEEYRSWKAREPKMTGRLIRAATAMERYVLRRAYPELGHEPFNLSETELDNAWNR